MPQMADPSNMTARPAGDRRRAAADAKPVARTRLRRTRLMLIVLGLTPIVLAVIAVLAITTSGPSNPVVTVAVPVGYQKVADGYYGYAVPSSWTKNTVYSDSAGDTYYQGGGEWSGANETVQQKAPIVGQPGPAPVATFGQTAPTPYQLSDPRPITIPGASFAYQYTLTRPGHAPDTAIEAYTADDQTELWLVIHASPEVTDTIEHSLSTLLS